MEVLSNDLILEIAERLDVKSILKLQETNKTMYLIIKLHERSLCRALTASSIVQEQEKILSSEAYFRRPLRKGTFQMALEAEKRKFRINDVLKNWSFLDLESPEGIGRLSIAQKESLYALLERAFSQCDYIADIAANAPCVPVAPQWYHSSKRGWWDRPDLLAGYRLKDPYSNYPARPSQLNYINSLPQQDLTMLYYFLYIMGASFQESSLPYYNSDPSWWERRIVFQENVLRHGSWFAWAYIRGSGSLKDMGHYMARVGLTELISFELGQSDKMPSLQSGLKNRFNELYQCEEDSINTLLRIVKNQIIGVSGEDDDQSSQPNGTGGLVHVGSENGLEDNV